MQHAPYLTLTAPLLALTLALAGCSGGEEATEEAAAKAPTGEEAAAPEPKKIEVAAAAPPTSWGRCAICHDATEGGVDKLGPNLWGVYGSAAGQGSFNFSPALKNSGLTWTDANLDAWLENPQKLVPGNRMSYPGLKDAAERQELIDYLKQQR